MGKIGAVWRWMQRYLSLTLLLVVAVLAFVLLFNDNSVIQTYEYEKEIERLKAEIRDNRDSLEHYERLNRSLETDPETMERIVREQYHMQHSGEDIYLTD